VHSRQSRRRKPWSELPDALLCAVAENRESEADRIIFNATAGYGATLIVVGMLALRYGVRMYYQHESMASSDFHFAEPQHRLVAKHMELS